MTDEESQFEVTIFSELLFRVRSILIPGISIVVEVETQRNENNLRLLAVNIYPLEDLLKKDIGGLKVYVNNTETILQIKDRVELTGDSEILIHVLIEGEDVYQTELKLGENFKINPAIKSSLKEIEGVLKIEEM